MAKVNEKTSADLKILRAQTVEIRAQIDELKKKSKLEAGITAKQEVQLATYERQLKLKREELSQNRQVEKQVSKQASMRGKLAREFGSLSDKQKEILKNEYHYADLSRRVVDTAERKTKTHELVNDLATDQRDLAISMVRAEEQIGTEQFSAVDTSNQLNALLEKRQLIQKNYTGSNTELGEALIDQVDFYIDQVKAFKEIADFQSLTNDKTNEMNAKVKAMNDKWNDVKATAMSIVQNPLTAMKVGILAIGVGIVASAKKMADFANESGLSYAQVAKLGPGLLIAGDEAKALLGEFGTLDTITNETLIGMKALSFQYGISADSTAKLMSQMMAVSGLTAQAAQSTIGMVGELARAEGVAPAAVLEDMAENTEFFASFAKDGGKNLGVAAVQARKLGLSLGTTAKIADSLLDFEGSIEKQMEASVLLGRNINLDKARGLAFSGDMVGLQQEVLSLVGSQSEFEAMNVIQRRALADSIGVGVDELSKMIMNQQKISEMTVQDIAVQESKANVLKAVDSAYQAITKTLSLMFVPINWIIEHLSIIGKTLLWVGGILTAVFLPAILEATYAGMVGFKNSIISTYKSIIAYVKQMWSKIFVTQKDGTASKISTMWENLKGSALVRNTKRLGIYIKEMWSKALATIKDSIASKASLMWENLKGSALVKNIGRLGTYIATMWSKIVVSRASAMADKLGVFWITLSSAETYKNIAAMVASTVATGARTLAQGALSIATGIGTIAMGAWTAVTWLATTAAGALAIALNATGIPAIVLGVVALVAGLYLLWKNFDKVKVVAGQAFSWIADGVTSMWDTIKSVGGWIADMFITAFAPIQWVIDKIASVGNLIGDFFGGSNPTPMDAPKLAGGGTIKQTGMAEVHKGEFVGQPNQLKQEANVGSSSTDMTETNKLLTQMVDFNKKLLDQNDKLMSKLIKTTGDLGVA